MEEFYRNRALNYGYIVSITLLALILILSIFEGDYQKFTTSVDLSDFSIKLVLILAVVVTYITLVMPSVKVLSENQVLKKTPPRGDKGPRGNRGKLGEDSVCNECGDDLCYKKIMFTITKTINLWRQENNMELLDENYVIENEYIKDKARKHCGSKQFKKLLSKFGSNNKRASRTEQDPESPICPKDIADLKARYKNDGTNLGFGCGSYDLILKMWTIWTLIILRYKNGMLFLESEGLNENDFVGMIEKEDSFKPGDSVKLDDNDPEPELFEVINNTEFPFFTIRNQNNNTQTVYINKIYPAVENECSNFNCDNNTPEIGCSVSWNHMFKRTEEQATTKELMLMLGQVLYNHDNNKYEMEGICKKFIKTIGNTPGGGKLSPFDEIKKYSVWYWGADPSSKPRFVIEKKEENKVCPSCKNSYLCDSNNPIKTGGIKVKFTNTYKQLVNFAQFSSKRGIDGYYLPFGKLEGNEFKDPNGDPIKSGKDLNYTIFRPEVITDKSEPHAFFQEYKPVGDVLLHNNDFTLGSTDLQKCFPKSGLYNDDLMHPVIGKGNKAKVPSGLEDADPRVFFRSDIRHNHVYTMLVAGDTRPPIDFELVAQYTKNEGFKKNYEGITIWKPISEPGYIALGFVIDTRPFDSSNSSPNEINKPPRNMIATVPKNSLRELRFHMGFKKNNFLSNCNRTSYINTFFGDVSYNDPEGPIDITKPSECDKGSLFDELLCASYSAGSGIMCQSMNEVDKQEDINVTPSSFGNNDPINALFKNKKYSIQKIYDNNNE